MFFSFQKLSLIDYPDKICAIVFLKGCNFFCPFCYNSELIEKCQNSKISKMLREKKEKEFFDYLKQRKDIIEGVCVTGGEPTIQKDLPEFLKKIKKMGFLIKLDTNGTNPEMLKKLIKEKLVDYIAMDVKAPVGAKMQNAKCKMQNESASWRTKFQTNSIPQNMRDKIQNSKYERVVGRKINISKIKKSIEIIKNSGIDYEFRTTVVPGLHTKKDIKEIARQIKGARKYVLQQFVSSEKIIDEKYRKIKPYSKKVLENLKEEIRRFFKECEVRN